MKTNNENQFLPFFSSVNYLAKRLLNKCSFLLLFIAFCAHFSAIGGCHPDWAPSKWTNFKLVPDRHAENDFLIKVSLAESNILGYEIKLDLSEFIGRGTEISIDLDNSWIVYMGENVPRPIISGSTGEVTVRWESPMCKYRSGGGLIFTLHIQNSMLDNGIINWDVPGGGAVLVENVDAFIENWDFYNDKTSPIVEDMEAGLDGRVNIRQLNHQQIQFENNANLVAEGLIFDLQGRKVDGFTIERGTRYPYANERLMPGIYIGEIRIQGESKKRATLLFL